MLENNSVTIKGYNSETKAPDDQIPLLTQYFYLNRGLANSDRHRVSALKENTSFQNEDSIFLLFGQHYRPMTTQQRAVSRDNKVNNIPLALCNGA